MLLPVIAFIFILLLLALRHYRTPLRHRWRRRQARVMASQLCGRDRLQPPQLLYARLRAMDPLAFEELLLESFERRGHKVMRNRRYTGDGGIDGQVMIDGATWLIQAKRYAGAIRPEHVVAFDMLCQSRRCGGLFIHTGRTGPRSRLSVSHSGAVRIISGRTLLALLTGGPFPDLTISIELARPTTTTRKLK
ncbi:restriction endonuclease [Sphingobium yanoikuyae]|uniref:Restriction endonuclease n=1 Tax=Sphingobium yanoikuyae TaxID=13690 RepID=A0A430BRF8_SPHYA|nr:restriction endonuclease [Sphingobium yanoikuyae]RSU55306.1 restriction endonuclease [Sphingobium yanoikuyae]